MALERNDRQGQFYVMLLIGIYPRVLFEKEFNEAIFPAGADSVSLILPIFGSDIPPDATLNKEFNYLGREDENGQLITPPDYHIPWDSNLIGLDIWNHLQITTSKELSIPTLYLRTDGKSIWATFEFERIYKNREKIIKLIRDGNLDDID